MYKQAYAARKWNIKIRQQYCILANLVLNEYKDLIQQKRNKQVQKRYK